MSTTKEARKNRFRDGLQAERDSVAQSGNPIREASASRFDKAESLFSAEEPKVRAVYATRLASSAEENQSAGRVKVPLSLVHDNPWNARRIYEADKVASMAASIKSEGQIYPSPVVPHPDKPGHWLLVDGHYRRRAIELLGETDLWVQVVDASTPKEMYRLSRTLNEQRSGHSALDNALAWSDLIAQGVYKDGEELGQAIGLSKAAVSKELSLLKLPEPVLEIIQENPSAFSSASAYEVYLSASAMTLDKLVELARSVSQEKLSKREVVKERERITASATRRPREISRQYKLRDGQELVGTIREWDSGRVSLDVTLLDATKRAALVDLLRTKFGMDAGAEP